MKTEKEHSKKQGGSFSKMAAAFASGAAAGIAVGVLISSDRGAKLRDKVKNLVKEFGGEWEDSHQHERSSGPGNSSGPASPSAQDYPQNPL